MNLIMISGPYTGQTREETRDNIEKARLKALEIISKKGRFGWFPITPHLNTSGFEIYESVLDGIDFGYWYNGYYDILMKCDAVFMLPGWENSKGAKQEYFWAKENIMSIYYDVDSIPEVF
jgi:hypothetical protein